MTCSSVSSDFCALFAKRNWDFSLRLRYSRSNQTSNKIISIKYCFLVFMQLSGLALFLLLFAVNVACHVGYFLSTTVH